MHHLQTVGPWVPLTKTQESIPNIPLVQQRQGARDEAPGWWSQGQSLLSAPWLDRLGQSRIDGRRLRGSRAKKGS